MARHYSTTSFFRNAPNKLLKRYFTKHNVLTDFDFSSVKEGNPEVLFAAWLALPEAIRKPRDMDFQEIFELSCTKGIQAIIDEAAFHNPEGLNSFNEGLAAKKNHYERAFATFLDYPQYWKGAVLFFHADSLSYWRKRKNFPKKRVRCDESHLKQLSDLIADYFHYTEGKGKHCFVDPLRRNDLDYFFAYPEDYSQRSNEWVGEQFRPRPHNPAFEVIYVYNQQEGTLDLHYQGNYKAVEPLQVFFAKAILGVDELEPVANDHRVYDLNPLLSADFNFVYPANSGIQEVKMRSLRLSSKIRKGDRITLESDIKKEAKAVYRMIEDLSLSLLLHNYYVTRVDLVATVVIAADKPPQDICFALAYPNSCSLKYEAEHLLLRAMLEQSGIEPKEDELPF